MSLALTRRLMRYRHGGSVVSLKWHSSLPYVTTAALDNYVRVWDARSGLSPE